MLEAKNLKKYYTIKERTGWLSRKKKLIPAVNGIDLSIHKGEIIGLLGVNGAGKTTTIKMLSTLLTPTSGSIFVDGINALKQPGLIKQRVNMIAGGERMLYWRLTARENLMYFGRLYGLHGRALNKICSGLINLVGLDDAANLPVERYSKGMKQRLQIARGLINDPDYLFLDEPTLGLDAPVARQLRKTVKDLAACQGKGILLTSHYLEEVEELCDQVYVIDKGHLLLHDTPEHIVRTVVKDYFLQAVVDNILDSDLPWLKQELKQMHISVDVAQTDMGRLLKMRAEFDMTPQFITFVSSHNLTLKQLEAVKPSLEDAIIQLVGEGGAS